MIELPCLLDFIFSCKLPFKSTWVHAHPTRRRRKVLRGRRKVLGGYCLRMQWRRLRTSKRYPDCSNLAPTQTRRRDGLNAPHSTGRSIIATRRSSSCSLNMEQTHPSRTFSVTPRWTSRSLREKRRRSWFLSWKRRCPLLRWSSRRRINTIEQKFNGFTNL